ncbi:hypothetical protein FRB96_005679 [Tulasnella sp. 330]|nr:hypothetical protein FRB96_005679 [Tulasnella sp. 330]KAG8878257.1 hypothetical protein FRB97_002656 [Tulasnella sp. 331]KAG8883370.1 hypothetical protein FRB98_003142 [Tulasnella sp. 332]
MGALENLLSGIGSIISGFINSILALIEGTYNIVAEIVFGILTLITAVIHGFISLGFNLVHFVYSNLAILLVLGGAFVAYSVFVAPQQGQTRRIGGKKRA